MCYIDNMKTDAYKAEIATLAEKYGLDFVVLFGSQATGKTHAKSDIDLAVITRGSINVPQLAVEFEHIFKRDDVEVVNLAIASPTLMYAVSRDGQLLYEKELGAYLRWRVYATKIWMDTEWLRRMRDRKLIDWSLKHNEAHV